MINHLCNTIFQGDNVYIVYFVVPVKVYLPILIISLQRNITKMDHVSVTPESAPEI